MGSGDELAWRASSHAGGEYSLEQRGTVTIQGFTDALVADAYNQRLSERRANAVTTWLVSAEVVAAKALGGFWLLREKPCCPPTAIRTATMIRKAGGRIAA